VGAWLKVVLWTSGVVGVVLLGLYAIAFDVWTVPTDDPMLTASIEPTLFAGDVVVVTRHGSIDRGNLVRCIDPQEPGRFVIARAIAKAGDQITINDEVVSLDGHRTPSPRACDTPLVTVYDPTINDEVELACSVEEYGETDFSALRANKHPEAQRTATADMGLWFLVSDDRHVHLDSRDFGQVDPRDCRHIVFRLVSAKGFGDAKKRLTMIW
jgi:signal peptidase I